MRYNLLHSVRSNPGLLTTISLNFFQGLRVCSTPFMSPTQEILVTEVHIVLIE